MSLIAITIGPRLPIYNLLAQFIFAAGQVIHPKLSHVGGSSTFATNLCLHLSIAHGLGSVVTLAAASSSRRICSDNAPSLRSSPPDGPFTNSPNEALHERIVAVLYVGMQACGGFMIGQHGRSVHDAIPYICGAKSIPTSLLPLSSPRNN